MQEMNAQELRAHLENCDENPLLLDVRQPWEYEICKIERSVLMPMSQIPAEAESLDRNREIVVICHHGIRSRSVGRYLVQAGFTRIINLSGGIDQWARTVDRQMPTY